MYFVAEIKSNSQQRLFTYYLRQAGKNGCVGLSLACNFIKKGLNLEVFLWTVGNFEEHFFIGHLRTTECFLTENQ